MVASNRARPRVAQPRQMMTKATVPHSIIGLMDRIAELLMIVLSPGQYLESRSAGIRPPLRQPSPLNFPNIRNASNSASGCNRALPQASACGFACFLTLT